MSDPISDLIIRLKNANLVNTNEVIIPHSNHKEAVLSVIKDEGFLKSIKQKTIQKRKSIIVSFGKRRITHIKRISTPGKRHYSKSKDIPRPLRGFGVVVVSTPLGLLSGENARKQKVGGELVCEIW